MRLTELEPRFMLSIDEIRSQYIDDLTVAHGVDFLCPVCFRANSGPVGTHHVHCWFRDRGVLATIEPVARWAVSGTGYADLTLSPSILLPSPEGCKWHGFVTNGEVICV